jgi:allene oxide cyclase
MRTSSLLASGLAAGTLAGSGLVASAAPQPQAAAQHVQTLQFSVRFSPFYLADIDPKGISKGDSTVFRDRLFDAAGHQVGEDAGTCPVTDLIPDGVQIVCSLVVALPQGQLSLQGLATNDPTKKLAITGGTDRYRTARGDGELVEFGPDTGRLTLHVIR